MQKNVLELEKLRAEKRGAGGIHDDERARSIVRRIELAMYKRQRILALISLASVGVAVTINELCASVDYREIPLEPEEQLDLEYRAAVEARKCDSQVGSFMKFASSFLALALVFFVVMQFRDQLKLDKTVKIAQTRMLLKNFGVRKEHIVWSPPVFSILRFLVEACLAGVHPLPMYHNDYQLNLLGTKMFYRFESLVCAVVIFQLYHVAYFVIMTAYFEYFSLEPTYVLDDKETARMVHESSTSHKTLSLKVAMSRHPLFIIACALLFLLFSTAYLVRIAEGPAHQPHSKYFWEQMWVVLTQATTGIASTTPATHLGRFASCLIIGCTPVIIAFLTAATTRTLLLNREEEVLTRRMDENRLKARVLEASTRLVQHWWRTRQRRRAAVLGDDSTLVASSASAGGRGLLARTGNILQYHHVRATGGSSGPVGMTQEEQTLRLELLRTFNLAVQDLRRFKMKHQRRLLSEKEEVPVVLTSLSSPVWDQRVSKVPSMPDGVQTRLRHPQDILPPRRASAEEEEGGEDDVAAGTHSVDFAAHKPRVKRTEENDGGRDEVMRRMLYVMESNKRALSRIEQSMTDVRHDVLDLRERLDEMESEMPRSARSGRDDTEGEGRRQQRRRGEGQVLQQLCRTLQALVDTMDDSKGGERQRMKSPKRWADEDRTRTDAEGDEQSRTRAASIARSTLHPDYVLGIAEDESAVERGVLEWRSAVGSARGQSSEPTSSRLEGPAQRKWSGTHERGGAIVMGLAGAQRVGTGAQRVGVHVSSPSPRSRMQNVLSNARRLLEGDGRSPALLPTLPAPARSFSESPRPRVTHTITALASQSAIDVSPPPPDPAVLSASEPPRSGAASRLRPSLSKTSARSRDSLRTGPSYDFLPSVDPRSMRAGSLDPVVDMTPWSAHYDTGRRHHEPGPVSPVSPEGRRWLSRLQGESVPHVSGEVLAGGGGGDLAMRRAGVLAQQLGAPQPY